MDLTGLAADLMQSGKRYYGDNSIESSLDVSTFEQITGKGKVTGKRIGRSIKKKSKKSRKELLMAMRDKQHIQLNKNETINNNVNTNNITLNIFGNPPPNLNVSDIIKGLQQQQQNQPTTQHNVPASTNNQQSNQENVPAREQNVGSASNNGNDIIIPDFKEEEVKQRDIVQRTTNDNDGEIESSADEGYDEHMVVPPNGTQGIDFWVCRVCTLENIMTRRTCNVCRSSMLIVFSITVYFC